MLKAKAPTNLPSSMLVVVVLCVVGLMTTKAQCDAAYARNEMLAASGLESLMGIPVAPGTPSDDALILGGAEDVCYRWKGGCAPTAHFCWLKYLTKLGFTAIPDVRPEREFIESLEWYKAVSQPRDAFTVEPDCTELDTCEPPSPLTSLAGYMGTSASVDGMTFGTTQPAKAMPGVVEYLGYISTTYGLPDYRLETREIYTVDWNTLTAELGRGYPLPIFGIVPDGGHFWTAVGYDPNTQLVAICSTRFDAIEWVQFGDTDTDVFFKVSWAFPITLTWEGMPPLPGLVRWNLSKVKRIYLPIIITSNSQRD